MSTFTEFKTHFYSRVPDLTLFDCGDINLLKVVLDGLKVDYVSKGKVRSYLFYPLFIFKLIYKLKSANKNFQKHLNDFILKTKNYQSKTFLVSDIGRIIYDSNKKPKSIYFDNIIKELSREKSLVIIDKIIDKTSNFDFCIKDALLFTQYLQLTQRELDLIKNLKETLFKIKKSNIFNTTEIKNIEFAFQKFFFEFKAWSFIFQLIPNIKICYFICHYHKEGQIYALKKNNIKCIELQHGLIAKQDIFYLFPNQISKIKDKALFADKIYVYGEYWRDLLLTGAEYSSNQIELIGYYLFDNFTSFENERNELKSKISDDKVILITSQTSLHNEFINFTIKLSNYILKTNQNYKIIFKLHPAENFEIYKTAFSTIPNIVFSQCPLQLLFEKTTIHVSVYSTTLYDALRYRIRNYVFNVEGYDDYVNEIVESKIARKIETLNDLFVDTNTLGNQLINQNIFYCDVNLQMLKDEN